MVPFPGLWDMSSWSRVNLCVRGWLTLLTPAWWYHGDTVHLHGYSICFDDFIVFIDYCKPEWSVGMIISYHNILHNTLWERPV